MSVKHKPGYGLSVANDRYYRAGEIQRMVADAPTEDNEGRMRHLMAIERLCCRGMEYSNQDFDVLSAAWSFIALATR